MDKNTIIGLVIISILLIGYMFISRPSEEEIEQRKRQQQEEQGAIDYSQMEEIEAEMLADATAAAEADTLTDDQIQKNNQDKYGIFANSASSEQKYFVVENNKMRIKFSNKGGKIYSVELKEYKTYDRKPLVLFENDDKSTFGIEIHVNNKLISTNNMYFVPMLNNNEVKENDTINVSSDVKLNMRLSAANDKYIEYQYVIHPDDYMLDFNMEIVGLKNEISNNENTKMIWDVNMLALERGRDWESNNTTIFMRMSDEDVESLGETKDEDSYDTKGQAEWIAYKQQFFSSFLISKDNSMVEPSISLTKLDATRYPNALKNFKSEFYLDYNNSDKIRKEFSMYFGPNKYSMLKDYDKGMETIIPLGWGIFGWVNKFAIIPMFNLLGRFMTNYGLIILLMTIIIKLVLFPLTYKSYMSTAKMRVLKPQLDALAEKYPKGKEMERQQAQMSLYRRAGVSPMGGCLPLLLQLPILIAMFRFFPASIELRQQSFLWANDLSSYDSILEWNFNIPILSSIYGNHISLFALLMAASMIVQQKITSNMSSGNSMPGMKFMMYFMPVLMLLWFNNYSSGLSYYYLLANLFSILQTWIIQRFVVNEEKLLAEMEANKSKPKKKSRWLQRLEEASKRQQEELKKRQKK